MPNFAMTLYQLTSIMRCTIMAIVEYHTQTHYLYLQLLLHLRLSHLLQRYRQHKPSRYRRR